MLSEGAAIHIEPHTTRYSNDTRLIASAGHEYSIEMQLPGYIRAAGKDPGFTAFALLEILRRRGKYHAADFARLHLVAPVDLPALKGQ